MLGLSADKAHRVAERLLKKVAEARVEYAGQQIQTTVSIGIAALTGMLYSWRDLFSKADSAL